MARTDIYRAKSEFAVDLGGVPVVVHRGDLIREGHPLLKGREALFEPYESQVRFEVAERSEPNTTKRGAR